MAADEDRNFIVEGSKPVTRTHYSRALITFSALMVVLLAMLLAAQRPADGLVIDGDLCLPPYCPPETTITSAPLETDTSSTARFEFRGSTYWSNLRFECQLDGGGWSACTSPKEYTGLSDGSHTFQVRAMDSRSIDYSPASHTWTIYATQPPPPDTIAPRTTLTNYPYSTITSTTARFDFTGSDDRTRPADLTFECRFDSAFDADWSACASPKEYAGLSDGPHTFQVRAKDPAGNVDLTPESRQFSVDTTPPNTNITLHPSDPSTDSFPRFEFSGSDNVYRFECRILLGGGEINDSGWFYCSSPYDFWSAVPRGTHTFQVRAADIWYRTDPTPASYTWTHAVSPETTIDYGPSGTVSGTTASFSFSSSDRDATFECRLDDGAFEGCVSRKEYTGLSEGRHTFEVRASTSAGTDATPETRTWTVDTVAPSAPTITSPSDDSFYADGNFTLSGVAENGSIVELLEGPNTVITVAASESGDWSVPLRDVAQGEHTYSAITRDAANNASERSGVLKVTVDTTAPRVDSTSPVPGEKGVGRAADITGTFSDRMDESTLTTQGLKLVNAATGKRVKNLAVRYDDATRTLEIDPFGSSVTPLAKNTKYRVTISTSVKNRAGSPLDQNPGVSGNQPKSWTFTTGSR